MKILNKKLIENFKGKRKSGAKLPLAKEHYVTIRKLIRGSKNSKYSARNLLLINIQVNSSFRASDVLSLKIKDVFVNGKFLNELWRKQKKTGEMNILRVTQIMINDLVNAQIEYDKDFLPGYFNNPELPLFPSTKKTNGKYEPLDYSTYLFYLKRWIKEMGLNPDLYGTHSLRSAVPLQYFEETGDLATTSHMFGHISTNTTQKYVEQVAKKKAGEVREFYQFED